MIARTLPLMDKPKTPSALDAISDEDLAMVFDRRNPIDIDEAPVPSDMLTADQQERMAQARKLGYDVDFRPRRKK